MKTPKNGSEIKFNAPSGCQIGCGKCEICLKDICLHNYTHSYDTQGWYCDNCGFSDNTNFISGVPGTAIPKQEKIIKGAEDFNNRFTGVMKELGGEDGGCCDNGKFGDGHACLKTPPTPKAGWEKEGECCSKCAVSKDIILNCFECDCHKEARQWEKHAAKIALFAHKKSKHYAEFSEIIYQGVKDIIKQIEQDTEKRVVGEMKEIATTNQNSYSGEKKIINTHVLMFLEDYQNVINSNLKSKYE